MVSRYYICGKNIKESKEIISTKFGLLITSDDGWKEMKAGRDSQVLNWVEEMRVFESYVILYILYIFYLKTHYVAI